MSEPGTQVGPAWTGTVSHPAILAAGAILTLLLWLRDGRVRPLDPRQALALLSLLLLLRCVLDIWNTGYYMLPLLLALLAWEVEGPPRRVHLLAASATALACVTFLWLPAHASGDAQATLFLSWSLPLGALLLHRALFPARELVPAIGRRLRAALAQEITVRPFSRPLSTS